MTMVVPNEQFAVLASDERLERTVRALDASCIRAIVTEDSDEARATVLELIPSGAEVYHSPSRTLDSIGLSADIETSTRFQSVRSRMHALDRTTQQREIRRLGASPDVLVGSVQAITEQGQILIASALGSQLSAAAWGAGRVIWVVGTHKLVRSLDDGFRRIREYSYPLEDMRTRQVYGQPSAINKILVVNAELPGRITVVLVKQNLGF
jgi:LUD domain